MTPAGRQLALARAARKLGAALTARLAPAVARAHGYRGYPWIANLEQGTVWRLPTDASDDLAGLAWIGTGNRLLCLDAAGLAFIDLDARTVGRIPGITGTAFAWSEAQ